ncbi:MAG TPA: hypothetical protein VNN10_12475 [Dehalococcoidia bacterium]|nr:hypothetical protein [Dehalococcoidia bacterium]
MKRLAAAFLVVLLAACSAVRGSETPGPAVEATRADAAARVPATAVPAAPVALASMEPASADSPPDAAGSYLLDTSTGALYFASPLLDGVWSPDGGVIAFARCCSGDGFIDLLDVRGAVARRVATGDVRDLAWSPDGSKLAFVPMNEFQAGTGVRVMARDGSRVQAVVSHMGAGDPRWLDEDRIAYTVGLPNADEPAFYLARLSDPGQQRRLDREEPPGVLDPRVIFGSPSADGAWVVYFDGPYRRGEGRSVAWERSSRRLIELAPRLVLAHWAGATHRALLLSIDGPTGLALAEVVDFASGRGAPVPGGFESRWAADAQTVVHLGYQCRDGAPGGETEVFATIPGGPGRNVSRTPGEVEYALAPAPDRGAVAFAAKAGDAGAWRLTVADLGTTAVHMSFDLRLPVQLRDGAWSPDGRYLLFTLGAGPGGACE